MPRRKTKRRRKSEPRPVKRYRNRILNEDLDRAYRDFCGVGLNRVRECLARCDSPVASAFARALAIECASRRAKRKMGQDASQRLYREKRRLMAEFVTHCREHGYAIFRDDAHEAGQPHVLYAYLPGCEQISWHGRLESPETIPPHEKGWDGKKYSTLRKLEEAIRRHFPGLAGRAE